MKTFCQHCRKEVEVLEPYGIIGFHGPGFNDRNSPICGGAWGKVQPHNNALQSTKPALGGYSNSVLPQ